MKRKATLWSAALIACCTGLATAEPVIDDTPTRVQTSLATGLELRGVLRPKSVTEISTSHWSIDGAGTDREHAQYHAYKEYLPPLGIRRMRTQAGWARCEKDPGLYDFWWLDSIVFDAAKRGIEVWLETSYGNPAYKGGGGRGLAGGMPSSPEALSAWYRWVGELAKRYKGYVRDWCVWNEPDLHGANAIETVIPFTIRTAEVIKREIPDARIAACALCWANPGYIEPFCKALKASGKTHLFTWIAYHHYAMNPDHGYDGEVAAARRIVRQYTPELRLWQNESGTQSELRRSGALNAHLWDEISQAKWDLRRYLADLGLGDDTGVFHACDLDYHNSGFHDGIVRYGLIKTAGQEQNYKVLKVKPAYYAVQNAVSVFNDAVASVPRAEADVRLDGVEQGALYVFRDTKTKTLLPVFWDAACVPSNACNATRVSLSLPGKPFATPVWTDVLTGRVYDIPATNVTVRDGRTVYAGLPCYDSPGFLADASVLSYVVPEEVIVTRLLREQRARAASAPDASGTDAVTFREDTVVLPTYAPGGYDKTPVFYTGRVYQGAQGRVYPYPMQDVLHDAKIDETYKYLTLENKWLQMGLLPEHGGHLLNFTDKATGFETFYRQHVVKPALIGMLGAWISGGVEWNFPHHHRATTAMPIDWRATDDPAACDSDNPAGTKTIWIGETELRRRLKWTIGLSLLPDRAVLQADNRFMNRGPFIESMIYWANVSVHCGDDYQILFPPSCHLGFDHHKNYWTSYPIGPRKEEVELLPSQRSKYADDISGTMDLSWWKNFTIESRSIFAMDPDNAWLAGYDHKRQMGTAHVSNRHLTVGKKFFLWGNFPEAHVWDTVLTDRDGPYLELMVGCWSDNQPDYSWIAPYETRRVKQFWFPVKGIGGVKNVTVDGAVNVERRGADKLLVGFHSTRVLTNCTVRVTRTDCADRNGISVYSAAGIAIDPDTPWCRVVDVPAGVADTNLTASIADAEGRVFLAYTPVGPDPHDPLPPKVENPKPPAEYASAELAYEVGLRLDQFHNGILDPEPYYRRALEIDPDYSRANLALGIRRLKNGQYAEAKPYLERAVKRATQNHTRATDAAPEYYLALCCRGLADLKRAEDLFWRCTWRAGYKKESYAELTRLACLKGDFNEALARIDDALDLGQKDAKLWTLKGYVLRRQGQGEMAQACFDRAIALDPLEYWGTVERDGFASAEKNRGLKAQQLLECVCDYWGVGAWDEVIALCDAALRKAAAEKPYATEGALPLKETLAACDSYKNPMFAYFAADAAARKGEGDAAVESWLEKAEAMAGDYCFPSRLEELAVLQGAAATTGEGGNVFYYLGEILWNLDQKEAAVANWKKAVECNPKNALALRCLGFALAHPGTYFTNTGVPSGIASAEAYGWYRKSLAADPENFRTLDEALKLAERLKLPAAERLALIRACPRACAKYDANMLRLAYCYNETGAYAKAHEILTTRRFHVWEGADGLLAPFVEACLGLGRQAMAQAGAASDPSVREKLYRKALAYFAESTTYPANLQAGRPGDAGTEPKSRYFMAQCKKALGDAAGYRAELEKALKGWIKAGEMDYWRVKALRELGRDGECAPLIAELRQAISELETPPPSVINAYAKFAGENSAMERAAKAREQADALKALLAEIAP